MTDDIAAPGMPRAAQALGWAGVLPFLGLAALAWVPAWRPDALAAFVAYGALILSFLGGQRWGRALAAGTGNGPYALAVVPSLWAWLAWMAPPAAGLALLALGFALLARWDRPGDALPAPPAFRRLRQGLSQAVLGCHALALAALLSAPA